MSDALLGQNGALGRYERWRDERAAGHCEFSFQFGTLPRPERSGPIFRGIAAEPATAQDLRDAMTRRVRPEQVLWGGNLQRRFARRRPLDERMTA